tara:strand:- start:2159 stop:4612 length:2454 start_codon:yes stop_codon:yes gene_type:complete
MLKKIRQIKSKLDEGKKYVHQKYLHLVQKFIYYRKLYAWKLTLSIRGKVHKAKSYFGVFRWIIFVVIGSLLGFLVVKLEAISFTQDVLSGYLFSIGAMTGGTIAIVFTISIFLLQNTANLYSSQYLEVYVHDWKEKIVYFLVIIITLLFLATGLYVGGSEILSDVVIETIVAVSLVLVGVVFALIDWQYKNVRDKTNPTKAIFFLERQGRKFLKKAHRDAEKLADVIHAGDKSRSKDEALATAYNQFLQPYITNLDRQLENLFEISMKLSEHNEIETTKRGFVAIHNILVDFFEVRKTSSLAIPSSTTIMAIESDSQSFLTKTFERLNFAGERFMRERNDEVASYIVDIYNSLATNSQHIEFIGRTNENPILDQIRGYLDFYIDKAIQHKNIEVVFQGVRALGNIGVIASEKGLQHTLHGLHDKILKVALFGLNEKHMVIYDRCSEIHLKLIGSILLSDKIIARHQYDDVLRHIATLSNYALALVKGGLLADDFNTRMSMSKAYDNLYMTLWQIMHIYFNGGLGAQKKQKLRSRIADFIEELNRSLRTLSENVKNADSTLIDSIGRLLMNVNELIINVVQRDEFSDVKEELLKHLSWNIHLPYWFLHHADEFDGGRNPFNTLTDCVAKTGILIAHQLKDKKLVEGCIDCLHSMTKETLKKTKKDSYGYDEPRVLEKACYLGILAKKYGWRDVLAHVQVKILEYQPLYEQKYFSNLPEGIDPDNHNVIGLPNKNQLQKELLRWRDDFWHEKLNGNLRIRDDAEALMYQLIERDDIDWFLYHVWGTFLEGSPVEDMVKKEFQQKLCHILDELSKKKDTK